MKFVLVGILFAAVVSSYLVDCSSNSGSKGLSNTDLLKLQTILNRTLGPYTSKYLISILSRLIGLGNIGGKSDGLQFPPLKLTSTDLPQLQANLTKIVGPYISKYLINILSHLINGKSIA